MARLACFVNILPRTSVNVDVFAFVALNPAAPTCEQRWKLRDGTRLLRDRSQDALPRINPQGSTQEEENGHNPDAGWA
jgi:hypothetical protein